MRSICPPIGKSRSKIPLEAGRVSRFLREYGLTSSIKDMSFVFRCHIFDDAALSTDVDVFIGIGTTASLKSNTKVIRIRKVNFLDDRTLLNEIILIIQSSCECGLSCPFRICHRRRCSLGHRVISLGQLKMCAVNVQVFLALLLIEQRFIFLIDQIRNFQIDGLIIGQLFLLAGCVWNRHRCVVVTISVIVRLHNYDSDFCEITIYAECN